MHPFFHGLLFGLIFIFFIGPALFALIQTSIQNGLKAAIFLALGISMSDIIFVILTLLGVSSLLENNDFKFWIGSFGSVVLIGYGIYTWFKAPPEMKETVPYESRYLIKFSLKGLLLNGLNPFIIFFWLSWVGFVSVNYDYGKIGQRYFFAGLLLTILLSDIAKATIAHRKKHLINPKFFQWVNKIVAVVLVLFGIRIIYFLIETYA